MKNWNQLSKTQQSVLMSIFSGSNQKRPARTLNFLWEAGLINAHDELTIDGLKIVKAQLPMDGDVSSCVILPFKAPSRYPPDEFVAQSRIANIMRLGREMNKSMQKPHLHLVQK